MNPGLGAVQVAGDDDGIFIGELREFCALTPLFWLPFYSAKSRKRFWTPLLPVQAAGDNLPVLSPKIRRT